MKQWQECHPQPCPGKHPGQWVPAFPPMLPSPASPQLASTRAVGGPEAASSQDCTLLSVCSSRVPTWPGAQSLCHLLPAPLLTSAAWCPRCAEPLPAWLWLPWRAGRCGLLDPTLKLGSREAGGWGGGGPSVTGACAAPVVAQWHVSAPHPVPTHPALSAAGPHPDP